MVFLYRGVRLKTSWRRDVNSKTMKGIVSVTLETEVIQARAERIKF